MQKVSPFSRTYTLKTSGSESLTFFPAEPNLETGENGILPLVLRTFVPFLSHFDTYSVSYWPGNGSGPMEHVFREVVICYQSIPYYSTTVFVIQSLKFLIHCDFNETQMRPGISQRRLPPVPLAMLPCCLLKWCCRMFISLKEVTFKETKVRPHDKTQASDMDIHLVLIGFIYEYEL